MRVLEGNPGRRPINDAEPDPAGALEEYPPPEELSDKQKAIWRQGVKNAPPGLLRHLDFAIFTKWVIHHSLFLGAAARVEKSGGDGLIKKGDGWDWNPYMSIMNKQSALAMKAESELGFTPSSRSRVKVEKGKGGKGGKGGGFSGLRELATD